MLIHQDLHILPIFLQAKHYLMHLQLCITAPLLLCYAVVWGGWLMPDRHFQYSHSWDRRQTQVECCSWDCLTALWTPCTEQARRQDSLLNQAQTASAPSRILSQTSVTSTAHVAELGLLLFSVHHVQAVRAWGQHFAMSLSSQSQAQSSGRSPISALKSYSILTTNEMSADSSSCIC